MPTYRCMNANCWDEGKRPGHDFFTEDKAGKCPRCGITSDDKRVGHLVHKLTVIHYDPPHPVAAGVGMGYALCEPTVSLAKLWQRGKEQVSGEPSAVTCPKCLTHTDFPKEWIEMDPARVPDWKLQFLP